MTEAERVLPRPEPSLALRAGFLTKVEDPELADVHRKVLAYEEPEELGPDLDEPPAEDGEEDVPGLRLPWGIRKRILDNAPPKNRSRPRSGDLVTVHLVTTLTDGSVVGSSRASGKPMEFVVDERPREVIEGLELAVQTMRQGEVAEFTIAPRFAYDDLGSPPLVPPDATIVCEVELISWMCTEDLFRDGRAVKTVVTRGTGEVRPSKGQEVLISLKVTDRNLRVLQEHVDLEHAVGAADFGCISPVVLEALQSMVEGETATVALRRFGVADQVIDSRHSRASMELRLAKIYRIVDVSPLKDGSLLKKVLAEGSGPEVSDAASVTLDVEAHHHKLVFRVGYGEACDALELAVAGMKVGERVALVCAQPSPYFAAPGPDGGGGAAPLGAELLGPQVGEKLTLTLHLAACEPPPPEAAQLDPLAAAAERKDRGAALFRAQRWAIALRSYDNALEALADCGAEGAAEAAEVRRACQLNRAACLLKLGDFVGVREACGDVLSGCPDQVKALFRRAAASLELSDYRAAQADLTRLLQMEPQNSEARRLLARVCEAKKRYAKDAKLVAARMIDQPAEAASGGEDATAAPPAPLARPAQLAPRGPRVLRRLPLPCCR